MLLKSAVILQPHRISSLGLVSSCLLKDDLQMKMECLLESYNMYSALKWFYLCYPTVELTTLVDALRQ